MRRRVNQAVGKVSQSLRGRFERLRLNHLPMQGDWWMVLEYPNRIARCQCDPIRGQRDRRVISLDRSFVSQLRTFRQPPEIAFLQARWDVDDRKIIDQIETVRRVCPDTGIVFLDWYAPIDIRHAAILEHVDLYVKKQAMKDRAAYARGLIDTNLVEYECRYSDAFTQPVRGPVDLDLLEKKLFIAWNFAASDEMIRLLDEHGARSAPKRFDLHCRIAVKEGVNSWYAHMRKRCLDAAQRAATSESIVASGSVDYGDYLSELAQSRACFSPFGYGEVCWRDFEAIACGAVVIKQDMGHLETRPDIYRAFETYVPVAWDLSDFTGQLDWIRANPDECERIAQRARTVWREYLDRVVGHDLAEIERLVRREQGAAETYPSEKAS